MDQLGKRLKRTIVTAEGGSPWGGLGTCLGREILKMYALSLNEAICDYFDHSKVFFHLLKSKKLLDTL